MVYWTTNSMQKFIYIFNHIIFALNALRECFKSTCNIIISISKLNIFRIIIIPVTCTSNGRGYSNRLLFYDFSVVGTNLQLLLFELGGSLCASLCAALVGIDNMFCKANLQYVCNCLRRSNCIKIMF